MKIIPRDCSGSSFAGVCILYHRRAQEMLGASLLFRHIYMVLLQKPPAVDSPAFWASSEVLSDRCQFIFQIFKRLAGGQGWEPSSLE